MRRSKDAIENLNATIKKSTSYFKPPEQLTVTQWADKYRKLSAENSAEPGRWKTSRTPYLEEIMNAFTDPKVHRIAVAASSQVGKALDIDTPIPTPTGWTTMGELKVGDKVYDENGRVCNVIFATEVMYDRKCYNVVFSDGSSIVADAEHRWYVESDIGQVLTTEEIRESGCENYIIPVPHKRTYVSFKGIEEVETRPVRCIQVDSPNHLYLAGRAMIPTHNTECEMNMLGYAIDIDPGPIMLVMPTVDNSKDFSKRRIAPMIRDTKPLREKISKAKSRDGENTVLKKAYPGGMLTMTGSNSPASLASVPARYVFGDERDRWAKDAGGEGDPWGLVEARTTTFYNYKMVEVSTPTIKGYSSIEKAFSTGTQEYWCVKCPHCGEYEFIRFDNIKFEYHYNKIDGKKQYIVDDVSYCCPDCGCISTEAEIRKQPKKWIAKNPEAYKNGVRSFWINAFSSPWMPWSKIVLKYLEAEGDPQKLKTVYNTLLGELWEDRGDLEDEDEMMARREKYEAELPEGVLCLTCGVDTQDNRLEYEVVGYGRFGENWGIEKGYIMGKPSDEDVWERLDGVVDRSYYFKDGKALKISLTFVDSGGHYTQEVYEECNKRINKRVFAVKGKGGEGIPFTKPPSKVDIVKDNMVVGKAWLYVLGVDAGKERIMSGLKVGKQEDGGPSPRYSHFPENEEKGYDRNFFTGLLSEKMTYKDGKWKWEKLPGHTRNEALDCRNYANAALRALNPNMDMLYRKMKGLAVEVKKPVRKKQQRRNRSYDSEW